MTVRVEYRCVCDECGTIEICDEWWDVCPECRAHSTETSNPPIYKGYKDRYTAYYGVEWREIRKRVLERAGYKCESCGLTNKQHLKRGDLFGGGLHVHHKTKAKEFATYEGANELSNLEALCATCHNEVEA